MIDKAVEIGGYFDWITPLWTLIQDWRKRPSAGFTVRADTAWSAYAVRDLLAQYGVETWGWAIHGQVIVFRLRAGQARFAEYLMDGAGVPWLGGSVQRKKNRRRK